MRCIGHHKESVVDKQDDRDGKSDINGPLQIRIDIIPEPIQSVRYLILARIRSLLVCRVVQCGLLDLVFVIGFADDVIQDLDRIFSILPSAIGLCETEERKRVANDHKRENGFFHPECKEVNIVQVYTNIYIFQILIISTANP